MTYFMLFSNCIITVGFNRSIICDLKEKQLYFVPNNISRIIFELREKTLYSVKNGLDVETQSILMKYIEYFIEEEIGFYCDDPSYFPEISLDYFSPETINNAILDLDRNLSYDIASVINELTELKCKFLEVRVYDEIPILVLKNLLDNVSKGYFRNVDIICKYPSDINDLELLKQLAFYYPIVGSVTLHSAPEEEIIYLQTIKSIKNAIPSNTCCGKITTKYFSLDIKTISESQNYNTCLNQKISIDVDGNIKNCPSMYENFGNIQSSNLLTVLENETFKKKWNIQKDQINVCKHCEFRHICTDCRAFLEDPLDLYSKPLKCGYNPETNVWGNWELDLLKAGAIKHYGFDVANIRF